MDSKLTSIIFQSNQIVHYTASFWRLGHSLHVKCKLFDFTSDAKNANEWMYAKNNFEKLWSGRIILKHWIIIIQLLFDCVRRKIILFEFKTLMKANWIIVWFYTHPTLSSIQNEIFCKFHVAFQIFQIIQPLQNLKDPYNKTVCFKFLNYKHVLFQLEMNAQQNQIY